MEQSPKEYNDESICSEEATRRGPGQRIISFSMYGENNKEYIEGLLRNIKAINEFYSPQYITRLYYSEQDLSNKEMLCTIFCNESNLDLCNVDAIGR